MGFIPADELDFSIEKVALLLGFYSLPVGLGVWASLEDKFAKAD